MYEDDHSVFAAMRAGAKGYVLKDADEEQMLGAIRSVGRGEAIFSLLQRIREHDVTSFCAPPTVWRILIHVDLSGGPGSLREVIGAGEPLNPEVIEQVRRAWGLTIRDGYGHTETTAQIGNTPGSEVKPGSMGRALPGVPVVLVDPVGGWPVTGPGEGEICLDPSAHPLPLMTGYQGDPERNTEAMAGGNYHTGDVASIDADGRRRVQGQRLQDQPLRAGVGADRAPAVAEAAVVPAPDPLRLAVPKAYIALAPGHEPTEYGVSDPQVRPRAAQSLPAGPPHRVLRAAEYDLRQDPPRRAPGPRGRARCGVPEQHCRVAR